MLDTSRYRRGERDQVAINAHSDAEAERRCQLRAARHTPEIRASILGDIADGYSPRAAARRHGSNFQAIYALAALDEVWRRALDAATEAQCICLGTGWRRAGRRRCYCPTARAYRAEEARRERRP